MTWIAQVIATKRVKAMPHLVPCLFSKRPVLSVENRFNVMNHEVILKVCNFMQKCSITLSLPATDLGQFQLRCNVLLNLNYSNVQITPVFYM